MKKSIVLSILFLAFSFSGYSQKMGHVNSQRLLSMMPESKEVQKQVEEYIKQLESQLSTMSNEYQSKLAEYQNNQALWSDPVKESKAEEISSLEKRIQRFQQTAQRSMSQKEEELFEPILDKLQNAIKKVADEHGYDYIFDSGSGAVLHAPDSDDMTSLIKKELGLE